MLLRLSCCLAATLLICATTEAVVVKRAEGFETYGPPRPAPQYGPPLPGPQHVPHREYGVPQKIPFREYGPPALKYGPPKLNFIGGGGGGSSGGGFGGGGIHEQIKTHFGVPKPFYGPPHIPHKPAPSYGPPLPRPQPQYGPPIKPGPVYGPPPKLQRPPPSYGPPPPPRPIYGPPPQALPVPHPAPLFKPPHQPATSYGPPPSGPLNPEPQNSYGPPPKPGYGPPPLPLNLPGPQPANFNRVPETTIILQSGNGGGGNIGGGGGGGGVYHGAGSAQQIIQIDSAGHTHSVSGSQAPFHTACDGWKPIPAPVGAYVEHNNIETQSGYSHVSQGSSGFGTQYHADIGFGATGGGVGGGISGGGGGGSIIDGLTDEQLVAVALQSGGFENSNTVKIQTQHGPAIPPSGPAGGDHGLNSIESEALQISLGTDDSYSKPPVDSYAPGSVHAQKYNSFGGGQGAFGLTPPTGNYGPPPPPPQQATLIQEHHSHSSAQASSAGLGIQYGSQSGNVHPFPPSAVPPPNRPVSFRPPVPQGLLESIGATVQHLDQFGVKPQIQPPTYIPPATNDIAQGISGPGNLGPEYGPPPPPPESIIQQQLPLPSPPQSNYLPPIQEPRGNGFNQYRPPPPPPEPQQQYLPPPPPAQQYLPPPPQGGAFQHSGAGGSFENSYSASQYNQQYINAQGLAQQQQQQQGRFTHVHDCGQGPNLVGAGYQFNSAANSASASPSSYNNAISQSIPVAEQHTEFLAGPASSYGPPPSGNDIDHVGYASQKSAVAALPDGTDPENLPGLDGLNVISAQKSQSIHLSSSEQNINPQHAHTTFQLDFGGSSGSVNNDPSSNHEEILSQGLLQSILTAIEQPQSNDVSHPSNHRAESRSDMNVADDSSSDHGDANDDHPSTDSSKVEVKASATTIEAEAPDSSAEEATVTEIKTIVPEDVDDDEDDNDDAPDNETETETKD